MAIKYYGYYLKGNKVAIAQRDTDDTSSNEYGRYKSPTESVTDGLEIEYTYNPIFENSIVGIQRSFHHKFIGWGRHHEGYLNLFTHAYGSNVPQSLTGLFDLGDYVEIKNSQRWNGFHKVIGKKNSPTEWDDEGSYGVLKLETKCDASDMFPSSFYAPSGYDIVAAAGGNRGYIKGGGTEAMTTSVDQKIEGWKENVQSSTLNPIVANRTAPFYMFMALFNDNAASGLYEVSFPDTNGRIQFEKQLLFDANGVTSWNTEAITAQSGDSGTIYQAVYEEMDVFGTDTDWEEEGIQSMDEDFILDLTSYQSKAIVYYLKAKMSEDARDMEGREYFMRLFKKQLEKERSGRKRGPYIAMGNENMRNY